jgi:hypothetical protein
MYQKKMTLKKITMKLLKCMKKMSGIGYTGPPAIMITSGLTNTTSLVGGTGCVAENTQITISGGGGSGAIITPILPIFGYN